MATTLIALVAFIITILIVTLVHELGHYLVARCFRVKVLVFSLGFGSRLIKFTSKANEWRISLIPLGGYVRFLDEREGSVAPEMQRFTYNRKPAYQKILIAIAGPLANLTLAVILYYFMALGGIDQLKPIIESVDPYNPLLQSLANSSQLSNELRDSSLKQKPYNINVQASANNSYNYRANNSLPPTEFAPSMVINSINNVNINSWYDADKVFKREVSLANHDNNPIMINVSLPQAIGSHNISNTKINLTRNDSYVLGKNTIELDPTILKKFKPTSLESIGLFPVEYNLTLAYIELDSPASIAGLKVGDQIIRVDKTNIKQWFDLAYLLKNNTSNILQFTVKRNGTLITLPVYPLIKKINHQTTSKVGIMPSLNTQLLKQNEFTYYPNTLQAFELALSNCYDIVALNLVSLYQMAQGKLSVSNLGGPVMVAKVGGYALKDGFKSFLSFLALISVGVALVNLLPIPILDGGHVLIYFIEWCIGREIDYKIQNIVFLIGILLMLGISITAFYNDILKIMYS